MTTDDDELHDLLAWIRDYGARRVDSFLMDERRCMPPHVVLELGERGVLGLNVDRRHGGLGLPTSATVQVFRQLAAVDLTLASFVGVHTVLGTRPILNFGSERQREDWLGRLAAGRVLGAFAMTESGAGSNVRAIEAEARPALPGHVRVSGTKEWIGNGSWAGLIVIFAKEWDRNGEMAGVSAFAVPADAPGLTQGPEALTMGMRAMVQNRVTLNGVVLPETARIGRPGEGLVVANDAMNYGRLGIAAMAVGGMQRCLQLAGRFARRRYVASGRLIENPVSVDRISTMLAAAEALDAFVQRVATLYDEGGALPALVTMSCKVVAPEVLWETVDHTVQLLGGRGYMEPNGLPQLLRDARLLRIFEGPTEALATAIGAAVLEDSRELGDFLTQHCPGARFPEQLPYLKRAALDLPDARLARYRLGFAVAWGIVASIAEDLATGPAPLSRQASTWAGLRSRLAQEALARPSSASRDIVYSANELEAALDRVCAGLSPTDPCRVDEDRDADALLVSIPASSPIEAHGAANELETLGRGVAVEPPRSDDSRASPAAATALEDWICETLARMQRVRVDEIDMHAPFSELGVDSVHALNLMEALQRRLDKPLDATLMWSYPTISKLANYLAAHLEDKAGSSPRPGLSLEELARRIEADAGGRDGDE